MRERWLRGMLLGASLALLLAGGGRAGRRSSGDARPILL